ncbi:MAG: M6 family metalloprotease domain-containing protein [Longimicrobiales bacterium]|nr:M6 family metalloprotease domain-containing protein [Longimicrobiales bacterium]
MTWWRAMGLTAALAFAPAGVAAQGAISRDVVHLGERYGTTPPASFHETVASDPGAFDFAGRGFGEARAAGGGGGGIPDGFAGIFGQFDGDVRGNFRFPVLLAYFPEGEVPAESRDQVQSHFFDGPNPTGTISEYWAEASNGRVTLLGETLPWTASTLTRLEVTAGESGIGGASRVGDFIVEVLVQHDDGSVDWGVYDNDGPDGIPNSGDDDGFVDVLGVIHPTRGAECGGVGQANRIWSHRSNLRSATGLPYTTRTPSAEGGFIRVNDYTIQPVRNCADTDINEIGVFTHELGHGFGLPDLYDTSNSGHAGIGNWGLMGSGNWGCDNNTPSRPCMPGAWTREQLGWATIVDLGPDLDHGIVAFRSPVEGGTIYRYRVPGTPTYYLLEFRGRRGFDGSVRSEGLLVWQIDEEVVEDRISTNRINVDPSALGVWIRQADGLNNLGQRDRGNRGDSGDPFPGLSKATAFHAGTVPSARTGVGDPSLLTLTGIALGSGEVSAAVTTASTTLTLTAANAMGSSLFRVDGVDVPSGFQEEFAPFEVVEVIASGGIALGPGVRQGFTRWSDGPAEKARDVEIGLTDLAFTAEYGTVEYEVSAELVGPISGVPPGVVVAAPSSPDFWFPAGSGVEFSAAPFTGFAFEEWGGALAGLPNPTQLTVDGPFALEARFSQDFEVESAPPAPTPLVAGKHTALTLEVRGAEGTPEWDVVSGAFPEGIELDPGGIIFGFALETGRFDVRVRVRDTRGLTAEADLAFEVGAPVLPIEVLAGPIILSSASPTSAEKLWLDREGNRNGRYDLGDAVLFLQRPGTTEGSTVGVAQARVGGVLRTLVLPATHDPGGAR